MKSLPQIAAHAQKLAADNSPALLTTVGVVGTVATAVLSGKAALKIDRLLDEEYRYQQGLTNKEKAKLIWRPLTPPVVAGALTITAIVGANRIGTRRTAAIATAYAISEKAYHEYKDKVIEKVGEKKERDIRDSLAQDRIDRDPLSSSVLVASNGNVMCYDAFSGRYFKSTVEDIKKAQNDTNYSMLNEGYASLNDFYLRAGLPATSSGEEVGWTADKLLEVEFSTCLSEDGREPCISIEFRVSPVRHFHKMN